MQKQFKLLIILVNALLSVLYVVSSFSFWQELNRWYDFNMQTTWTPFYVYPHRIPDLPTVTMPISKILNFPFIIFCATILTNCILLTICYYIIPKLQKRATKNI